MTGPRVLRGLAALTVLLLFAHISWADPNRSVGVLYDDSSSMKGPLSRWLGANFSLQVMASLLSEGDELFLVKMNAQPKPRRYEMPTDTDALLSNLISESTPSGKTPYTGIGELLNSLQSSKASEKWLLVVTDGEFTTFSPTLAQQQIDTVVKPQGIRVVFLLIERRGGDFEAARYWQSAAGATIVDAASGADVPKRMEEIAAMLTGRDPNGISLKRDGDDFVVSSLFPLRGLVTLVQGSSGIRVTGAAAGQTAMTLRGHAARARLRHADIPQAGHVAHMLAKDGIAAGDQVARIRFSGAIGRDRIKVFPEVAARMEVTVIDAAGKTIQRNAQGVHSVCRDDDVEFRTRFEGPDGKPITIGRSDLATFDVGLSQPTGSPLRSTIDASQSHFTSRIKPTDELRLVPFGRYPGYFSYQGDVIHLRTVECKREIVVALDSKLNSEGIWSEGVERLETAAPLAFRVTIDGTPATEADLKTWMWRTNQDARWTLQVKGEKLLLSPIGGCCVAIWSRPQAHRGELKFQGLDTGTATDKVRWPAPVAYAWTLPENVVARLWWLYGCPLAALVAIVALGLYLWRILVTKERFGRRAAVHVLKDRKHDTMWLCRAGDLPTRWLWPSRRETKRVGNLRFLAVGKGGSAVLVSGKGLTQRHEIEGWEFDEQLQAQKKPQRDARLRDQSTIIRRTGTGHRAREIDLQMLYTQRGQQPNWPR